MIPSCSCACSACSKPRQDAPTPCDSDAVLAAEWIEKADGWVGHPDDEDAHVSVYDRDLSSLVRLIEAVRRDRDSDRPSETEPKGEG